MARGVRQLCARTRPPIRENGASAGGSGADGCHVRVERRQWQLERAASWAPATVPDNDQSSDYDVLIGNRVVAANATVTLVLPANGAQCTAIVRGVNGATGVAVVEMYALP